MADDVILAKAAIIERCVVRVREVHGGDDGVLTRDITRQDSIVLNLQRACEASIDLAMGLLERASLMDSDLTGRMSRMVGFRNIAVHDYRKLSMEIVASLVRERLDDFLDFTRAAIALA